VLKNSEASDSLSLFHSELLKFLLQSCQKQIVNGEIDPKQDARLQTLLEALHDSLSKGQIPLNQIVDNYQQLFISQGAFQLEKSLQKAFKPKDFVELGLTRYYPRIYRGLPRFYNKDHASESHIKDNFTHLPSLKREMLNRALFSLYNKVPLKGKVTLFTWVMPDGLGDFVAAIEVMRLLKGRLPDLEIQLIGLVQEKILPYLSIPEHSLILTYQQECPVNLFSKEALSILNSSDLILQIPTYYPHTEELKKALPNSPKMECIGEYGFLETPWFHPKSGNHSLGLHFLEKGILTRKACQATWNDVQNEQLKNWYSSQNLFYLAYLTTPIGGAIYLHALLKSLENSAQDIDLCTPDPGWFLQFSEQQEKAGRPLLEWQIGVRSIEIYYQGKLHIIKVAEEGKKIRLLCPGLISQSDFRVLLALSGDWVGVRGNQSFSEVVSQGKAFFYDGRQHSRYLIKDFLALAENRIPSFPGTLTCIRGMAQGFIYNLPVEEGSWVEETFFQELEEWTAIALNLGLALQDPQTITGYQTLNRILVDEFSANSFLCHLVQRALFHKQHPEIEQFEKEQVDQFITQTQTLTQLIQNQREKLNGFIHSARK
jgi:hypothetical protein